MKVNHKRDPVLTKSKTVFLNNKNKYLKKFGSNPHFYNYGRLEHFRPCSMRHIAHLLWQTYIHHINEEKIKRVNNYFTKIIEHQKIAVGKLLFIFK